MFRNKMGVEQPIETEVKDGPRQFYDRFMHDFESEAEAYRIYNDPEFDTLKSKDFKKKYDIDTKMYNDLKKIKEHIKIYSDQGETPIKNRFYKN
jgi:hypothetical protein